MAREHDPRLPDDLRAVEERLRRHRLDAEPAELERVKRRAMSQSRAGERRLGPGRSRLAAFVTAAVMLAGAGGAVALSGLDSHPNVNGGAADKQYKPPPGCKHHPHRKKCVHPPVAHTRGSKHVTTDSATITGSVVVRNHIRTKYYFIYGVCPRLNHRTESGHTSSSKSVSAKLTGLKPDTKYCYELIATNSRGTSRGGVRSFRTPGAPSTGHHKTGHHKMGHHQGEFHVTHRRKPSRPPDSKKGFTG
jgi:hypothetical protein